MPSWYFEKTFEGVAIFFLQIAMTIYGNKSAEEMRTIWKMIYRNKRRKNYEIYPSDSYSRSIFSLESVTFSRFKVIQASGFR